MRYSNSLHRTTKLLRQHPHYKTSLLQLGLSLRILFGADILLVVGAFGSALQELNVVLLMLDAFLLCCHKVVAVGGFEPSRTFRSKRKTSANFVFVHTAISMNDDSVQLDTYTEVYDADDYPEYETRPIELFSPLHKLVLVGRIELPRLSTIDSESIAATVTPHQHWSGW